MKFQVKEIEVTFDRGSFEDWANTYDPQLPDDVERWREAYHDEIKAELKDIYPNADVKVEEGFDQTGKTKYYVTLGEVKTDEDYEGNEWEGLKFEDQVKLEIDRVLDVVSNKGKFWEA